MRCYENALAQRGKRSEHYSSAFCKFSHTRGQADLSASSPRLTLGSCLGFASIASQSVLKADLATELVKLSTQPGS